MPLIQDFLFLRFSRSFVFFPQLTSCPARNALCQSVAKCVARISSEGYQSMQPCPKPDTHGVNWKSQSRTAPVYCQSWGRVSDSVWVLSTQPDWRLHQPLLCGLQEPRPVPSGLSQTPRALEQLLRSLEPAHDTTGKTTPSAADRGQQFLSL